MAESLLANRTRLTTILTIVVAFAIAIAGMDTDDWVITLMRGLSLGMIIFLVASGLSLIFGLMDVLNLAHGELFMVGAYAGWTVYVRPDTFVDVLTPLLLIAVGLVLIPLWRAQYSRHTPSATIRQWLPWLSVVTGVALLWFVLPRYPLAIWNPDVFSQSPATYSLALSTGTLRLPESGSFEDLPALFILVGTLLGGALLGISVVAFQLRGRQEFPSTPVMNKTLLAAGAALLLALIAYFANDALTEALLEMSTTLRFFLAMAIAMILGVVLGLFIEISLIRPLYSRPIYQLMITLGLSFILIEVARTVWGRPEFTMPKAALFEGSGDGCPARTLGDLLQYQCSTVILFDGRIRTYNEIFIILVGLIVLVLVWLLLQRTRIGMIIRAGVQDREMVEALGINVQQVFTLVFALGVGLATLGGMLAAPSIGLSSDMGTKFLLRALIALAIGGLTSFPGAAVGALLVGLLEQFVIKYGQIGIDLPFLAEPFKPSPPLVPASTVLLMVIILLILPNGLFGRNE